MNLVNTSRKKVLALAIAIAMLATLITPLSASAYTVADEYMPDKAISADDGYVKVGAHAAATSAVHYLGGNLVTERKSDFRAITEASGTLNKLNAGKDRLELAVYGTNLNVEPDPYMWNYLWNLKAAVHGGEESEDAVFLANVSSPMAADTAIDEKYGTSLTLVRRPAVLYGIDGGYDDLLSKLPENQDEDSTNDYDPIQVPVKSGTIYDQITTMYDLAKVMQDSGDPGRYGDPVAIASKYERFVKGIQLYIMEKIKTGDLTEKTVAIITPNDPEEHSGLQTKYQAYTSDVTQGTAASTRAGEYTEHISKNLVNELDIKDESTDDNPLYYLTSEQLKEADVIVTIAQSGAVSEEEMKARLQEDGWKEEELNKVDFHCTIPDGIFGITMNSVENIFGVGLLAGFMYPEAIDPIQAGMYLYETFWHVDGRDNLEDFAAANFENSSLPDYENIGIETSPEDYNRAEIEGYIAEGLNYYSENSDSIAENAPQLEPSENINYEAKDVLTQDDVEIKEIASETYTGNKIEPEVSVSLKSGDPLEEGKHYTVKYSSNLNVGKATAKVIFMGDYTGSATASFEIKAKNISSVTATISNQLYTGKAIVPTATVKDGSKVLKAGTDYTITAKNNVKVGTATATITGKGNYAGNKEVNFNIASQSITRATVSTIGTKTYNGRLQRPTVTVKLGTTTLKNGTDYTVSYRNNKKPGKATVTITGTGNYAGTKTATFKIKPKKAAVRKATAQKNRKLKVTWKRDSLATGYQVVVGTNAKVTKNKKVINVTRNKTTSKTFKKLKKGKRYYVKVRSYKKVDGKKLYGAYSKAKKTAKIKR